MTVNIADTLRRVDLEKAFPGQPRLQRALENQASQVDANTQAIESGAAATDSAAQATYVTLSANAALPNERRLALTGGLTLNDEGPGGRLIVGTGMTIARATGGFPVTFIATSPSQVAVPLSGFLATTANPETLSNKTLATPKMTGLGNYANDAAAAAGGVPVDGIYRNGSVLMVRVV